MRDYVLEKIVLGAIITIPVMAVLLNCFEWLNRTMEPMLGENSRVILMLAIIVIAIAISIALMNRSKKK